MKKLVNIFRKIIFPNTYSQEAYIEYLRKHNILIGEHVSIYSPNHTHIDVMRPFVIKIGDYCKITSDVTILAHNYSISVSRRAFGVFAGGGQPVEIGNNCFIGTRAIILMGTTIGDNCIIGAGSVVKGIFPDNVVIAGNPAKIVCSLDEYYNKCLNRWVEDAKRYAQAIRKNSGRNPTIEEMSDGYAWLYLERTKKTVEKYKSFFNLSSDIQADVIESFMNSKPIYSTFDDFLKDCNLS